MTQRILELAAEIQHGLACLAGRLARMAADAFAVENRLDLLVETEAAGVAVPWFD